MKPVSESDLFDAMMSIRGAQSESVLEASVDKQQTTGRLHILVAEDNSVNQEVARQMLQKHGYSVTIASNGREAVKLIAESAEFDVILMDIQMPEMDGFHATAAIREIESKGKRRTPIVAMTAHAMKGDRERCLEAGMDGYVSKPVQSKVLYETIEASKTRPQPLQNHCRIHLSRLSRRQLHEMRSTSTRFWTGSVVTSACSKASSVSSMKTARARWL